MAARIFVNAPLRCINVILPVEPLWGLDRHSRWCNVESFRFETVTKVNSCQICYTHKAGNTTYDSLVDATPSLILFVTKMIPYIIPPKTATVYKASLYTFYVIWGVQRYEQQIRRRHLTYLKASVVGSIRIELNWGAPGHWSMYGVDGLEVLQLLEPK